MASLAKHAQEPLLIVSPNSDDTDSLQADLQLFTELESAIYPAWETSGEELGLADEVHGERIKLLKKMQSGKAPPLVLAGIQSLLQPIPSPAAY